MQTKKQSFIESTTNTAVGFVISLSTTFVVMPLFGFNSSFGKNLGITLIYTVISIFRGYLVRRFFNKKTESTCNNVRCLKNQPDFIVLDDLEKQQRVERFKKIPEEWFKHYFPDPVLGTLGTREFGRSETVQATTELQAKAYSDTVLKHKIENKKDGNKIYRRQKSD